MEAGRFLSSALQADLKIKSAIKRFVLDKKKPVIPPER